MLEENYGKSQLKMDGFCTGGHPVYPPGIQHSNGTSKMYFQDFLHFFYLIRLISNATLVCQPVSRNPLYVTLLSSFADVVGRCCGQVFHQRFNCQVRHRRFLEGPVRTKGCREGSQGKGMKIGRASNFGVSFCEWVSYICKVCKFFYTTLLYA